MNYVLEHLQGEGGWDAEVNDQYLLFCSTLLSEKVSHEAHLFGYGQLFQRSILQCWGYRCKLLCLATPGILFSYPSNIFFSFFSGFETGREGECSVLRVFGIHSSRTQALLTNL